MAEEGRQGVGRFLTLTLGGGLFAIDIYSVREILDLAEITRIPETPEYMRGVVNVRGSAVPVIDLRMKFGMGEVEKSLNTRIVILEIGREEGQHVMGILADSVKEVLELELDRIDPPPRMGAAVRADFVRGIAKHGERFILILDMEKVLSTDEIVDVAQVMEELPGVAGASGTDGGDNGRRAAAES